MVVYHQIQAARLNPRWLLSRLYWQGVSTVLTRRLLHYESAIWRAFPRRLLVAILFSSAAFWPAGSTRCMGMRWRWSYAAGYVGAALGWIAAGNARRIPRPPV